MHCPKCGQQQISDETRFCSRCGLLLSGIAEIVANDGMVSTGKVAITGNVDSPRRRGIKQGIFFFLLGFLVVPLLALLTLALGVEPFMPAIGALLFGVGSLLRIAYALMFESNAGSSNSIGQRSIPAATDRTALPGAQSIPASAYTSPAGSWRDTNDLQRTPGSVTDSTTKLLEKDDLDQ
jgi:hypothetical protein